MQRNCTVSVRSRVAIACAAGVALWAASLAPAALIYRTVALTATDGVYGPGAGTGLTYSSLTSGQPSLNSAGQVLFRGQDSTTGNPNGLWLRTGNANAVLALNGAAMPGGGNYPTGPAAAFNSYGLNNAGQAAWRLGSGSGAFSTAGGVPTRTMLTGDFAPGTTTSGPLAKYGSLSNGMPLSNQAGQTAFMASITLDATLSPPVVATAGSANSSGIWIGTPGNANLVLRQNDVLTSLDASGNTRLGAMQSLGFTFNGNNEYAVVSALQGSNVVTGTGVGSNAQIIATNRGGSFSAVARAGSPAPDATGAASTNLYRSISSSAPAFNNLGHVAFSSSLRDAAGTQTVTGAMFTDSGTGTMRMIAKVGDAMPTVYSRTGDSLSEFNGVTWGSIYSNPLLNGSDQLLMTVTGLGNTGGSSNTGAILLMDPDGTFHKIQRNGDVAIVGGAPNGTNATFSSTGNYQINSAGQVAFMSNLTGTGVSIGAGNGSALWASDVDGTLLKIARTSDLFEVAPGDLRTITAIGGLVTAGGQDGRAISLADSGELAFQLDFSDGTGGIFVVQVPEPSFAVAGLGMLGALVARRRRGRRAGTVTRSTRASRNVIRTAMIAGGAVGLLALNADSARAETVQVSIRGTVEWNDVPVAPLNGINENDSVTMTFNVDSNNFVNNASFPTRGYVIDQSSFQISFPSLNVGLQSPFPAGQTPYFCIRNNDPAVDGFFLSTDTAGFAGVPTDVAGQFGNFNDEFHVTYGGTTLSSLNILGAVGEYDFDGLTVFNWSLDDGPFNPLGILFSDMTISVVPEPTSMGVIGLAAVAVLRRRRRGR